MIRDGNCYVYSIWHSAIALAGKLPVAPKNLPTSATRRLHVKTTPDPFDFSGSAGGGFDLVLKTDDVKVIKVGPRKPNLNAYAERFVQTLQSECLDHFIVFGEKHLNYLVNEFVDHYHEERPHQGIDNHLILGPAPPEIPERAPPVGEIVCHQRLGGLLKHYQRKAA